MRAVEAAHLAPLDPFEMGPQPLTRIQLGSIGREPFPRETVRGALRQQALEDTAAVHRSPIPNDDHAAGYLPPQMLQNGDDILRMDRMILAGDIPRAFGRDGADGREMVTPPPLPHDGRVPDRGLGAHDPGQRIAAGLVYAENRVLRCLGPRLRAGQVSSRQRAMAASSRWRARRAGVCGLQPIAWSRRPPWTGW